MLRLLAVAVGVGALFSAGAVASIGLLRADPLPIEWAGAGSPLPTGENAPATVSIAHAGTHRAR